MALIVVALGGNALGNTPEEQKAAVRTASGHIAALIADGNAIAVSHGNGPQVGLINQAMNASGDMPFPECGAMSQGYIGYHLQNALAKALRERGIERTVATVVTQVVVDRNDPKFLDPSKPIGSFYTEAQAKALAAEKGYAVKEDAGRGWRRVVASPSPVEIVELPAVRALLDSGAVPIASGGGGIPVVRLADGSLEGVAAVIDKDFASEKLAEDLGADVLLILTAVDRAAVNFRKPDQRELASVTVGEAKKYIAEGQFAPGSMLPKMQAAVRFAESRPGRRAIITSLEQASLAAKGLAGTILSL
ncbi:MAG: carbamate kinase [Oscillospiraceae bacterium]|nr:carbamate kinase [Oscillospiraceae bacterium]